LIDRNGFVPEAVHLKGPNSSHILNFNSPGATGAPAYSATVIAELLREGRLDAFRRRVRSQDVLWDFESAAG
jgi:L-2-hydroxyglutarate oxidase